MSSVDKRVVEMQFDNGQFESNVQTSLKSLDNLKKGLDLEGASKGLNELDKAGKSFSLAGIATSVESISSRFSALGIIGITVLQNIANSAIEAGKQLVSSLTIEPIAQGFAEYELKMGSVQTIMASTGASLETVMSYLNELNDYADKTIYSFSDMTTNIGKFTNAGVSLEQSVAAIQGISNAAALSGSNAYEASRAMYNFAQAISAGYVKLIDWKSIELANMATVDFKNQLIETAVALGTVKDMGDGTYQSLTKDAKGYLSKAFSATQDFNNSLSFQWLTTDVLVSTLGKYADETTDVGKKAFAAAQDVKTFTQLIDTLKEAAGSGWAETWENLIGNFDEAKAVFKGLSDTFGGLIGNSAKARNELLSGWKGLGGRTVLIIALKNVFEALSNIVNIIKGAFHDIFPKVTSEQVYNLTESFRRFTARLFLSDEASSKLRRTFKGLFALLDIGKQAFVAVANGMKRLIVAIWPTNTGFLDLAASVGDWLVKLNESIRQTGIFNVAIDKVGSALKIAAGFVKKYAVIAWQFIAGLFDKLNLKAFSLSKIFSNVNTEGFTAFMERIKIRFEPFSKLLDFIKTTFGKTVQILKKIAPLFFKLASMLGDAFIALQDKIIAALDNADFNSVFDIINGALFTTILLGIRKLIKGFGSATDILDGVKNSLSAFQSELKANALLKIAISIAILAASLVVLSLIDSKKLTVALAAMTTMFVELFGSMAAFAKTTGGSTFKSITRVAIAMIGISVAILILSFAMTKLSKIDWNGIAKGLVSIGALMGMLVIAATILSKNANSTIKGAIGFVIFAAAILILVSAVERLGALDIASLGKGLLGVGVLIAELAIFMKTTNLSKMGLSKGLGLLLLAAAIVILASAVKKLGDLDLAGLAKGLAAIGILLAELAIFMKVASGAKKMISIGLGLILLAAAMSIFAGVLERFAAMSWENVAKSLSMVAILMSVLALTLNLMPKGMVGIGIGLIGVAAALLIISNVLNNMGGMSWGEIARGLVALAGSLLIIAIAMNFMKSALGGAAALLVVSVALAILGATLKSISEMSLGEIGKSLLFLVGVFAVIGVAGLVLGPLIPVILGLAAAIALFGIGLLAIGAGMLLFSAGLAALAVSGTAGAAALVVIVTGLIGLIPMLLEQIGLGIVAFAKVIIDGLPVILEAVYAIFYGLLVVFGEIAPTLADTILNFILTILLLLVQYVPQFTDAGMKILIGFINGIANNMSQIVQSAIDVVLNFLDGISQKLPEIADMGFKMFISLVNGVADAIRNNHTDVNNAVKNLIDAIGDAINDMWTDLKDVGKNIINGLISGIKSMGSDLYNSAKELVDGAVDKVKDFLGIASPSKVFAEIGRYTGMGLIVGLMSMSKKVQESSKDLGKDAVGSISKAISAVSDSLNSDVELQPTIRPIVDLTSVQKGLSSEFEKKRSLNVSGTVETANKTASYRADREKTDAANNVTDNTNNAKLQIINHYNVRNDNDVRKISSDQRNLIDRYILAKGVPVR